MPNAKKTNSAAGPYKPKRKGRYTSSVDFAPVSKEDPPDAPIERLPPPSNVPTTDSRLQKRQIGAASVNGKGHLQDWELEFLGTNPARLNQRVMATSSNAAAHGLYDPRDTPLYDLFDEMMDREPIIASSLELKVAYLLMRPHRLEILEATADDPRSEPIYQFVNRYLCKHEKFMYLLWTLALGTCQHGKSTVETTYDVTADGYFIPEWFYHCYPGQFLYDRKGCHYLPPPKVNDKPLPVVPKKFISSTNPALYDNPFGMSDLFRLRFTYYFKKKGWLSFVRVVEKDGVPLIIINVPKDTPNAEAVKTSIEEALGNLLEDDALVLMAGETVSVEERASDTGHHLFKLLLEKCDDSFVRHILGASMATSVPEKGARSLGEVHERTVLNKVLPLARLVESAVNTLIKWLVEWNFGPDAPVPFYNFDTEPNADAEQSRLILQAAVAVGIPVAVAQAREMLGLRPPDPNEATLVIGRVGVNGKGEITVAETAAAPAGEQNTPVADPNAGQATDPEPVTTEQAALGALTAFRAFMGDPQRKTCADLFQSPSLMGTLFREMFVDVARDRQQLTVARVDKVANFAAQDSRAGLLKVVKALREDLEKAHREHTDTPQQRDKGLVNPFLMQEEINATATHSVTATAMLALYSAAQNLRDVRAKAQAQRRNFAEGESYLDDLPEGMQAAAQWMGERGVMTVAAVKELSKAIVEEFGGQLPDVERALRREVLAMANATGAAGTLKVQGLIDAAIEAGQTVGEFLEEMDDVLGAGALPGALDSYWNMVFRTEVANAYDHQQQATERLPEYRNHLWGWEAYNPSDDRSRPTHARLKGRRFKAGGTAAAVLGRPPFAYQCRCSLFAIMAVDVAGAGYQESTDALSVASNVQKFSEATSQACELCACE